VDIPGVKKEDISVDIKDRLLAISANREGVNKSEGESFKVVERFQGHISRHVKLPENIDEESIDAKYQDGVLDLKIHKKEPEKNEHLAKKVEIK
jgi:HSP20 family protein